MNTVELIQKLQAIEHAIESETPHTIRKMVIEAQDCALRIQRDSVEQMRRDSRMNVSLTQSGSIVSKDVA